MMGSPRKQRQQLPPVALVLLLVVSALTIPAINGFSTSAGVRSSTGSRAKRDLGSVNVGSFAPLKTSLQHRVKAQTSVGLAAAWSRDSGIASNEKSTKLDASTRLAEQPDNLAEWLVEHGGVVGPVSIDDDPEGLKGWGLKASRDVEEGEVLVTVPRRLCLSTDRLGEMGLYGVQGSLRKLCDAVPICYPAAALGLVLISERTRKNSTWKPYWENLPRSFSGVPLFYHNSDVIAMITDHMKKDVADKAKFLMEFTKEHLMGLPGSKDDVFSSMRMDANSFGWGMTAASSRAIWLEAAPVEIPPPPSVVEDIKKLTTEAKAAGVEISRRELAYLTYMAEREADKEACEVYRAEARLHGRTKAVVQRYQSGIRSDGLDMDVMTKAVVDPAREGEALASRKSLEMVPFIDMANHNPEPNAKVESIPDAEKGPASGVVRLVATKAVKAGEWVEICYGPFSNDVLLQNYGFTLSPNPFEAVVVDFQPAILKAARATAKIADEPFGGVGGDEYIDHWQSKMFRKIGLAGENADVGIRFGPQPGNPDQMVDGKLLAGLRVLFARGPEELKGHTAASLQRVDGKISNYNERRVLQTTIGLCALLHRKLSASGSVEADEEYLFGKKEAKRRAAQGGGAEGAAAGGAVAELPGAENQGIEIPAAVAERLKEGISVGASSSSSGGDSTSDGSNSDGSSSEKDKSGVMSFFKDPFKQKAGADGSPSSGGDDDDDDDDDASSAERVLEAVIVKEEGGSDITPTAKAEESNDQDKGSSKDGGDAKDEDEPLQAGGYRAALTWDRIQAVNYRLGQKRLLKQALRSFHDLITPLGVVRGSDDTAEIESKQKVLDHLEEIRARVNKMKKPK